MSKTSMQIRVAAMAWMLAGVIAAQQLPTFQSRADLVQIPVTVLDHHGKFVDGLSKDDFRVKVDGKPVALVNVDRVQPTPPPPPLPAAPPNVYSNGAATQPAQRIILLVDYEHTPMTDLPYLRMQLKQWFKKGLPPGEQVAVFALDQGLEVLQPFTNDRDVLEATADHIAGFHSVADRYAGVEREMDLLEGLGASASDPLVSDATGSPDAPAAGLIDPSSGLAELQQMLQRGQYADTMHGLEALAEVLEGVPGRKSVIWLTERTSLNGWMNAKLALNGGLRDQAFGHLNQANVALFPLDVSGLKTFMPPMSVRVDWRHLGAGQGKMIQANSQEHLAMNWAAQSTGGEAFFNTNGFGDVLTSVIAASRETYLVSFTPPPMQKGHEYRTVKVEVAQGKGWNLLYRRQYLQPDMTLADQQNQDFAGQIRQLALEPLELGSLPLVVKTAPLETAAPGSKAGDRMKLALLMPYKPVIHLGMPGGQAAAFDFTVMRILVPLDDPARVLVLPPGRFQKTLTAAEAEALDPRVVIYRAHLDIPPGHLYAARLAVRDNLTGQTGTVSFRVDARRKKEK